MDAKETVKWRGSEEKKRRIVQDESSRWYDRKAERLDKRCRKTMKRYLEG
jgi:hypothetical protein